MGSKVKAPSIPMLPKFRECVFCSQRRRLLASSGSRKLQSGRLCSRIPDCHQEGGCCLQPRHQGKTCKSSQSCPVSNRFFSVSDFFGKSPRCRLCFRWTLSWSLWWSGRRRSERSWWTGGRWCHRHWTSEVFVWPLHRCNFTQHSVHPLTLKKENILSHICLFFSSGVLL